jgi:hypothetical protein
LECFATMLANGWAWDKLTGHSGLLPRVWGAMLRAVPPAPGLLHASNYTPIGGSNG